MKTKYEGLKKYRTEWTIEPDSIMGHGVHWFRGDYDGDPMKHCDTIEEAEREIDDAIIVEQEAQIEKLKYALKMNSATIIGVRNALGNMVAFSTLENQLKENDITLKQLES